MSISNLSQALKFYFTAKTINSVHSPFLYDFLHYILDLRREFYIDYSIEAQRQRLLKDKRIITYNDIGAGSHSNSSMSQVSKSIAQLTRVSSSNKFKCRLIRNVLTYFNPRTVIELGTNFGIATAYMHHAVPSAELISVEGIKPIYDIADDMIKRITRSTNLSLVHDTFDGFIEREKAKVKATQLVYIDGNHTYEGTISYAKTFWELNLEQPSLRANSKVAKVLLLDDIYWSKGMQRAWLEIKSWGNCHTVDLYKLGIVLRLEEDTEPIHIKCLPRIMKPLSFGFFG